MIGDPGERVGQNAQGDAGPVPRPCTLPNDKLRIVAQGSQESHIRMSTRKVELPGRDPLPVWLIFTGVSFFAFVILWYYGLIERMVASDRTYISSIIGLLYIGSSLHCLWRILVVSREGDAAVKTAQAVVGGGGFLSDNIARAGAASGAGRLDQTLLLRVLADRLRGSNPFGVFAGDTLMKLGLLGTIIGFIMMLAPIAGLDPENRAAVRSSMSLMSDGMAVAMYTTLVGLVGSILVRIQYALLDRATAKIFAFAVDLTEVHVVSALERRAGTA